MCFANYGDGAKEGSIGKPLPTYEVKVFDEFGEELPTGLSGEIVLRPTTPEAAFLGYYREHDRTAENMTNGWFHTGDRGYVDTEGYFFFIDRKGIASGAAERFSLASRWNGSSTAIPKYWSRRPRGSFRNRAMRGGKGLPVLQPGMDVTPKKSSHGVRRLPYNLVPRYVEIVRSFPKQPSAGSANTSSASTPCARGGQQDRRRAVAPTPFEQ
jgi:crotonobetaine/carnitine-CoA ligase